LSRSSSERAHIGRPANRCSIELRCTYIRTSATDRR
jgi:hypothetical protein